MFLCAVSRRKKTSLCDIVNIQNMLNRVVVTPKEAKQPTKKRIKKKPEDEGLQKLDEFLIKRTSLVNIYPGNSNEINEENESKPICKSTPRRTKTHDNEVSFHYNSDSENSPIRKISVNNDYKTMSNEISIAYLSRLEYDDDEEDLNLSDIVNSVVSREHCNLAVEIWRNFIT